MSHINIEIKARLTKIEKIRRILRSGNAEFKGTDRQVDTYFKVPQGRLKLREGKIENFLIFYNRENKEGPKQSNVSLFPIPRGNSSLKEILLASLGKLVEVDKQREIYFIGNVKIHLDRVKGLGWFIEIEAIDKDGTIGKVKLLRQCRQYMKLFGINKTDLISSSYSDLRLKIKSK